MDEVPIVTANPVNLVINKQEPTPKPTGGGRIKETLKNFFLMLPLAAIITIQFFFIGKSFGNFSTFPLTSFTTYILLSTLLLLVIFTQMLMRSLIYSSIAGAALLAGIFNAWVGDFYSPMLANLGQIDLIIKSAWGRKDLPLNLLVSGSMTALMAGFIFLQFFAALIIKSFFEILFGKEWGDGRLIGFLGAIALLLGMQFSFYSYASMSSDNKEKLIWKKDNRYNPVEKFITRTPDSFLIGQKHIYYVIENEGAALEASSGKVTEKRSFKPAAIQKGFQLCDIPVFASQDGLYGFNKEMNTNTWKTPYPASYTGVEIEPEKQDLFNATPLTTRLIDGGRKLLSFYDYGYIAAYDCLDGKELWLKSIDLKIRANRLFPELYLEDGYFLEIGNKLIISCHNGLIRCLNLETGEDVWRHQHSTPKISGKSQKGYLSAHETRVIAAFKSGEIITLNLDDGRKVYQAVNSAFSTTTPVYGDGLIASLLTEEGIFYQFELDGGKVLFTENILPRRLELVPVVKNLQYGIVAHRDEVKKINTELKSVETILKSKNRVFVTNPVFDEKMLYIGTQDGWIYGLHIGSKHIKWQLHVDGELMEDSLTILGDSLLVKTSSGSLYRFNRSF